MSVYTKLLSQLTFSDLQELLDASAVENLRLEFKREVPDKDNTLKKISSFANAFGGFIVVGASADNNGRIQELVGVDKQPSYKQTVVSWCFDSVYPPITVDVSDAIPVPSMNARFCYVISVPESDSAPHFLNGRKGIWIRTNEFSARFDAQLANEDELQNLLARRRVPAEGGIFSFSVTRN
jgi:predicted HTH transcriptional regulator